MTRAQTTMDFNTAYDFLVELEGGLLKIDAGEGIQYGGILQKWYEPGLHMPGYPRGERLPDNVLDFTPEQHEHYVFVKFWLRLFSDSVQFPITMKLFQGVAAPIFFMAYNAGHEDAVRCAQRTMPFLKEDGILGPRTYSFLHSIGPENVLEWWKDDRTLTTFYNKEGSHASSSMGYFSQCAFKYKGHTKEAGLLNRLSKINDWLREEVK